MKATAAEPFASRFSATVGELAAYALRAVADRQIRMVLELDGRVDAEGLLAAVRLVVQGEPILGCRLVDAARRPYWERRDDIEGVRAGAMPLAARKSATSASRMELQDLWARDMPLGMT